MTYREATEFLFNSLPMYQRVGKAAYKADLVNTLRLDAALGHPHRKFPSVHVAGTNGKGSVSHMLASVFQQAGFRTALYTSPHLLDFRERIRVNGKPVPEKEVVDFVTRHKRIIGMISPSFFEMTVAMAFDFFARQQVEMAVIETGLGGRLDSTNIITPVISVITNVSMDHTEFLGNDLSSIAREKGGIIKKGIPVVVGRADDEREKVFRHMAWEKRAEITFASRMFIPSLHTITPEGKIMLRYTNALSGKEGTVVCDLAGDYQHENLMTVLTVLVKLRESGWDIPEKAAENGLSAVSVNTGLLGRWQTVDHNPRSICDVAHNQEGIAAVMKQLMQLPRKSLHIVFGLVKEKDLSAILPLLPVEATYYFTPSSVPRSMDAIVLQAEAGKRGLKGRAFPSVEEAYRSARQRAQAEDVIFTGGSTFVVADLLKSLGSR
ncbi:MAG TPA: bifunctional folylpolyglutamate synthase/dihydrofolate synthase [Bacteroides sp.]|nr:bifunctional folylpolyglutamate synthase/dihydrofolate synthase [Bacteroides sp.]